MTTTSLLHGLRIAQHLVTEAASYGVTFMSVQVGDSGSIAVHLDGYTEREGVFASHLLDVLDLDLDDVRDFPVGTSHPFRSTDTTYRGTSLTIFGSLPVAAEIRLVVTAALDVTR
jgi:hypothetical protein